MAANNEAVKGRRRALGQRTCAPSSLEAGCLYSPSLLERLSGKYPNGSDRAFLGSTERRKLCHFAPSCGLLGPRNGARSEFPDSLSRKLGKLEAARSPTGSTPLLQQCQKP